MKLQGRKAVCSRSVDDLVSYLNVPQGRHDVFTINAVDDAIYYIRARKGQVSTLLGKLEVRLVTYQRTTTGGMQLVIISR